MRLLMLSFMCAMMAAPMPGVAAPEYQSADYRMAQSRAGNTKKQKRQNRPNPRKLRYVDINLLHASLPGSHLYDDGCLLFHAGECDIVALADVQKRVTCFFVRTAASVKKAKRRETLETLKNKLQLAYDKPAPLREVVPSDGSAVLLYYDWSYGAGGSSYLGVDRCSAVYNLLKVFDASGVSAKPAAGLACGFSVEKDGVELELALDMASPTVNYAEIRGGKVQNKGKTNPEEVVESVFPDLDSKPARAYASFGKGENRLRTLVCNDTHYLARDGRFFVAGTVENIKKAVDNKADFKKYGFDSPNFSSWEVTLPTESVGDTLLQPADEEKKVEPTEAPKPTTPETEQGTTPPKPTQEEPAQPAADSTTPLTPEAAREAYRKMLGEM